MGAIASQITSLTIVYSTVYSDADQRKHQSFNSLACVIGIHQGPMNSLHKRLVTPKMFPFDDIIINIYTSWTILLLNGSVLLKKSLLQSHYYEIMWVILMW